MDDAMRVVTRTGVALVTQGELVVPRADAEAVLTRITDGALVLEFPVEVEVRLVPACDPEQHVDTTLARLTAALESLA